MNLLPAFFGLFSSLTGLIVFRNIFPGVETPGYGLSSYGLHRSSGFPAGTVLPRAGGQKLIVIRNQAGFFLPAWFKRLFFARHAHVHLLPLALRVEHQKA